ncbi:hypothetical protein MMC24_004544 [Lignoscripta atroalba]|nr:hypothetical protein [Lignoscripta atroalba]
MDRPSGLAALRQHIHQGNLFDLTDTEAIKLFGCAFAPELHRLKNASSTVESSVCETLGTCGDGSSSPSQLLFGTDYAEVNRTLVGMLALKWLMLGDYETFTLYQKPAIKLCEQSFNKLRSIFVEGLKDPEDIYALLIATVVNDIGKDPHLAQEVASITGHSIDGYNHDKVVYAAAQLEMLPLLEDFDGSRKTDMILGLQFGSELNAAQLAQAENVPGSLKGALIMKGHKRAFDIKYMELLLDVAGSDGHIDSRCAEQMIEPVCQAYLTTQQVLLDIVEERMTLRTGYDQVLRKRGDLLRERGFKSLSVNLACDRALLRLLTMGRTATKEQAEWFTQAFDELPQCTRRALVLGLSVDGYNDGRAIVPYYMPALFAEALKNMEGATGSKKVSALASLMRFLARVYDGTKPERGQAGVVTEYNLSFAQDTVKSKAFMVNPNILDEVRVS